MKILPNFVTPSANKANQLIYSPNHKKNITKRSSAFKENHTRYGNVQKLTGMLSEMMNQRTFE